MALMQKIAVHLILYVTGSTALAGPLSEEFLIKKEYQKARVEDFYTRLIELDREEAQRNRAALEMRKTRKQLADDYEQSRRNFVKNRTSKPPLDPSAWERELKKQELEHQKAREAYVRQRNELRRFMSGLESIPEDEEFDINPDYQEEQTDSN